APEKKNPSLYLSRCTRSRKKEITMWLNTVGLVMMLALALSIFEALLAVDAQPPGKMWRIGYLSPYHPTSPIDVARFEAFRRGLLEFGYVEGQNIITEYRSS